MTRTGDTTNPLTVSVLSADPSEATVPASVTIPAGAPSATFPIAAVNDAAFDGTQRVRITAWADSPNPAGTVAYDPAFRPRTPRRCSPCTRWPCSRTEGAQRRLGNATNLTVTRHLPDGTPDPTFGFNGVASVTGTGYPRP